MQHHSISLLALCAAIFPTKRPFACHLAHCILILIHFFRFFCCWLFFVAITSYFRCAHTQGPHKCPWLTNKIAGHIQITFLFPTEYEYPVGTTVFRHWFCLFVCPIHFFLQCFFCQSIFFTSLVYCTRSSSKLASVYSCIRTN